MGCLTWLAMSDHSAATRRYAFLTPGSSAASARRSHSRALTLCSCTLDGISSDLRKHSLCDRLNPWQADWFHSCDGENVACDRGWLRAVSVQPGLGMGFTPMMPSGIFTRIAVVAACQ